MSDQEEADSMTPPPLQAELAFVQGETPIGCVFVHDGKIIGRGINDTNRSLNVRLSGYRYVLPTMMRR